MQLTDELILLGWKLLEILFDNSEEKQKNNFL